MSEMPSVVADDEGDVAGLGVVGGASQSGDIDPGHGSARHRPGGRHGPVAAVEEPKARGIGQVQAG